MAGDNKAVRPDEFVHKQTCTLAMSSSCTLSLSTILLSNKRRNLSCYQCAKRLPSTLVKYETSHGAYKGSSKCPRLPLSSEATAYVHTHTYIPHLHISSIVWLVPAARCGPSPAAWLLSGMRSPKLPQAPLTDARRHRAVFVFQPPAVMGCGLRKEEVEEECLGSRDEMRLPTFFYQGREGTLYVTYQFQLDGEL